MASAQPTSTTPPTTLCATRDPQDIDSRTFDQPPDNTLPPHTTSDFNLSRAPGEPPQCIVDFLLGRGFENPTAANAPPGLAAQRPNNGVTLWDRCGMLSADPIDLTHLAAMHPEFYGQADRLHARMRNWMLRGITGTAPRFPPTPADLLRQHFAYDNLPPPPPDSGDEQDDYDLD